MPDSHATLGLESLFVSHDSMRSEQTTAAGTENFADSSAPAPGMQFPHTPWEEDPSGLAREQLNNGPTQISTAQPRANHVGLANVTRVPQGPPSEPPSANGSKGSEESQNSQRVSSHSSSPESSPNKQIIHAVEQLGIKIEGAIMKGQTKLESLSSQMGELNNSVCEAVREAKAAKTQHHANMEKLQEMLLAAETQRHAAEAQHHAAETKHQANMEKLHQELLAAEAQRHADSEKLLAAIANKNNYAPGAFSDA